jgi:two-component system sporulation sensor kinase B
MISFRIIEEMGGTLRYESQVNFGTKATIVLPIEPTPVSKSAIIHN